MTIRAGALISPTDYLRDLAQSTSSSAGFTSTETVTDTLTVTLVAGQRYRISFDANFASTVAGDVVIYRIREDSVSGTTLQSHRVELPAANTSFEANGDAYFTASVSGSKTFVIGGQRSSGTGTVTRFGSATSPSNLAIESW